MNSIIVTTYNRLDQLQPTLEDIVKTCVNPYEVIIVVDYNKDDVIRNEMQAYVKDFVDKHSHEMILGKKQFRYIFCEKNVGLAVAQNIGMDNASSESDCLIHYEGDIVVGYNGWNKVFEDYLNKIPELGMVVPKFTGRGEFIQRQGYREYSWALGGIWGIKKEVYAKIGGWDESLAHQLEPDYCLRVRMEGWRVGEIDEFARNHLGEGAGDDTPAKKELLNVGVYNFNKKWNKRFMGWFDYSSPYVMVWTEFPPNVFFRHLAYAQLHKELNKDNIKVNVGGGWMWETLRIMYYRSRLDPEKLDEDNRNNVWFKDKGSIMGRTDDITKEHEYNWNMEYKKREKV